MLTLKKYSRVPFDVEAVEINEENIEEAALWCGGEVRTSDLSQKGGKEGFQQYIKVPVKRPMSDRQTRAYFGDWVASVGGSFKVYTPKAWATNFEESAEHMIDTLDRMDKNIEQDEKLEAAEDPGVRRGSFVSPGQ